MPQFRIEQLALSLNPKREQEALKFLAACGISNWTNDTVRATGTVYAKSGRNVAELKFNYEAFDGHELELLKYTQGDNWIGRLEKPTVTHIGMHCSEEDLGDWRKLMADFEVELAQEVWTDSHTNPRIANCRRYHYVIYATRDLIGVDMKFIVRRIIDEAEESLQALAEVNRNKVAVPASNES